MNPKASPQPQSEPDYSKHTHSVQFYSDDPFLIDALSRFMGAALGAGDAGIVIATEAHRSQLAERLSARGVDVNLAVEQGRYVALDAAQTLAQFMVNGFPDPERFAQVIGGVISRAKVATGMSQTRASLFGEMVALLWGEGKTEAALRLEQLWNQIAQSHSFSLVCAYPLAHFYRADHSEEFLKVCAEHSAVIPGEDYTLAGNDERYRIIAYWQQRAQALDSAAAEHNQAQVDAQKLAAIVQSSDDGIVSKDLKGIVTSWNAAAERIFGWKAEEMVGHSILKIIPPELHCDEDMILGKIARGERLEHFETVRLHKSGRRIHVSITVSPVRDASGRVTGAAKIARDITERINTEQALRRTEKLAATGQLAASIAHEINNPMQALANLLSLISYKTSLDDNTRKLCALADSELHRMAHITRQMLSFYRESAVPVPLKLTEVMEDVLELFAQRLNSNGIKVERRYDLVPEVHAYPVEMRQLFANLIANAIEATDARGRIVIHVSTGQEWSNSHKQGVRITIADNGSGIPPDARARIFEPFFTTKAERGTGLGLWVANGIVGKHGGSIRLHTSVGKERHGTVFSIFLPLETEGKIAPQSIQAEVLQK